MSNTVKQTILQQLTTLWLCCGIAVENKNPVLKLIYLANIENKKFIL